MKLKLPSGLDYRTGANNERICVGSMMGRPNLLPATKPATPPKFTLNRLKWVSGDYDQRGAYWGRSTGEDIYWAVSDEKYPLRFSSGYLSGTTDHAQIFVRAFSRTEAKEEIKSRIPDAKFYR